MKHSHQHQHQTLRTRRRPPSGRTGQPCVDKEPVLDSREYLCIHEIPRLATSPPHPQSVSVMTPSHLDQGLADTPSQQPNQVEGTPELELMELDVLDDIPDLIDVPKDIVSDFEAWPHDVLTYQS